MRTLVYIAFALITTSCSSINFYSAGKLKKVNVNKTNEIAQISAQNNSADVNNYGELINETPPSSGEYFSTNLDVPPAQEPLEIIIPTIPETKNQKALQSYQHFPKFSDNSKRNKQRPLQLTSFEEGERTSFVAIASALFCVIGAISLALGVLYFFTGISSVTSSVALLIIGGVSITLCLIFYLIASRRYEHSELETLLLEFVGKVLLYIGYGIILVAVSIGLAYLFYWLSNM